VLPEKRGIFYSKIKDNQSTDEVVSDGVAKNLFDALTETIADSIETDIDLPVLTIHWKSESLTPDSIPINSSVKEIPDSQNGIDQDTTELEITVYNENKLPIENAAVIIEKETVIDEDTTDNDGRVKFEFTDLYDTVGVFVSRAGYQNYFNSVILKYLTAFNIFLHKSKIKSEDTHEQNNRDGENIDNYSHQDAQDLISEEQKEMDGRSDENNQDVDIGKRDLLIELLAISQQFEGIPSKYEINTNGEFRYEHYLQEFGSLLNAFKEAGVLDSSVTENQFNKLINERNGNINSENPTKSHPESNTSSTEFKKFSEIKTSGVFEEKIIVKVIDIQNSPTNLKDYELKIVDLDGDVCELGIWKSHDIDELWERDRWYVLSSYRSSYWEDNENSSFILTSTEYLTVEDYGPISPGEKDEPNGKENKDSKGIMSDILSEFEDL